VTDKNPRAFDLVHLLAGHPAAIGAVKRQFGGQRFGEHGGLGFWKLTGAALHLCREKLLTVNRMTWPDGPIGLLKARQTAKDNFSSRIPGIVQTLLVERSTCVFGLKTWNSWMRRKKSEASTGVFLKPRARFLRLEKRLSPPLSRTLSKDLR